MATIVTRDGTEEIADSDPRIQAYRALQAASERMGRATWAARVAKHGYKKASKFVAGRPADTSDVTDEHRAVCKAMGDVLAGTISPESAMALLHEYDVLKQRLVVR